MDQHITNAKYGLPTPEVGPVDNKPVPGWPIDRVIGAVVCYGNKIVVTCQTNGTTGFPKTHPREGESEADTVRRCLKHETGLDVEVDLSQKVTILYPVKPRRVNKEVTYYLATPTDPTQPLISSDDQIADVRRLNADDVESYLYYPIYKRAWRALRALIPD